jgi:hypothetical protein
MKVTVTFDTGHPAKLPPIDGAVAFIWQDERPLRGIAARADWRLNGFLSRLLQDERFRGDRGDWLLVPSQGRLPWSHLFLVGMGKRTELTEQHARKSMESVATKVAMAGIHGLAIDLAELSVPSMPAESAMLRFLEALGSAYPKDEFADPVYRPAMEARTRNEARLEASRKRRAELLEARRRWEAEQREPKHANAEQEPIPGERHAGPRPVAGQVPDAPPEPLPPPDPASVPDPELEPKPERTVRVVLLGEPRTVSAMRQALKAPSKGRLDVEWSQ